MIKQPIHIEIVRTTRKDSSSLSDESCQAILAVLRRYYTHVGVTTVNNESDLYALVLDAPDLVFLGIKYLPAEPSSAAGSPSKIWVSEYLESHGIAHTGSNSHAIRLEINKARAKQCITSAGLDTSAFFVTGQQALPAEHSITLQYPLFVKPNTLGGGRGIDAYSVVSNYKEFQNKITYITNMFQADSLTEEYLPGREFSVAILRQPNSNQYDLMPIELISSKDANGHSMLSEHIKSSNAETVRAVTDRVLRAKVTTLALKVFEALGARDYGRVDIRLNVLGVPQFLEANLIPSLIDEYGSFPKASRLNFGITHEGLIVRIVELGLLRADLSATEATPALTLAPQSI